MQKRLYFKKMRKEVMGTDFSKKGFEDMAYAHNNLHFKQNTVLYTGTPAVEDVKYVESKIDLTSIESTKDYRNRVMVALGVSFLNPENGQTVTTANLSISQLLKYINTISIQGRKNTTKMV